MGKYKYKPDFRGFSRACKDKKLHFLQPEEYAGGVVVFGVWQPGPSCLSHLALTTVTEFSPSWQTGLAHPISLWFWLRLSSHQHLTDSIPSYPKWSLELVNFYPTSGFQSGAGAVPRPPGRLWPSWWPRSMRGQIFFQSESRSRLELPWADCPLS